ncbi:MAG: HAMP domain-containing histidine kinase [Chitinophaga sp.]|uniref:sensor histidine kinase n=1 Tax=Chitinophaga sp. TaxID=1869181 RepID=UPI001B129E5B|nr:HAMP domain-containing sensor histidine kinase [Chitinophaga sp.]MBO9732446.1 HAMP domain-containing histidine kinase [Chitinophaga sp.]
MKQQLENIVNEASLISIYQSLGGSNIANESFRQFLLSPQWGQLRNAFDNSKIGGLRSSFDYDITPDSIEFSLRFKLKSHQEPASNKRENFQEQAFQSPQDVESLHFMDSLIREKLSATANISSSTYALYSYGKDTLLPGYPQNNPVKNADFRSNSYSYNLHHFAKYRLFIPSLSMPVWYLLRYFLLSNLITTLIISFAFYFLLRFIRLQQLFSQERLGFISNMTHEFKTPVATISVALESIVKYKMENNPEQLYEYIHMSQMELERLNFMIEKILNLKPEEGTALTLHIEPVDLPLLIQHVINSLALLRQKKKATIHFDPCQQPIIVMGDRIHLGNVFVNVLDNALKYTEEAPQIHITCKTKDSRVVISVKDNGIGIAPIYHKKIFERFFRIPDFDVHNTKGSGLGLHYVKEILQQHGATIKVQSNKGYGSTFIIQFPLYEEI